MKRRCDSDRRGRAHRAAPLGLILILAVGIAGCDQRGNDLPPVAAPDIVGQLLDPTLDQGEQIERILAEGRPGNSNAVPSLIRVFADRSQRAFLLAGDTDHALGYRAAEFKEIGPDVAPMRRVAAICALEKIGSYVPLPDLALALDDRHPVVANHAARALIRLGCRAGLPVLVSHLELKAFASETASRILREISGENYGFSPDIGHEAKSAAIAKWKAWLADLRPAADSRLPLEGRPYRMGQDGEADRRIQFFVDMLGQMQFLYHEQVRTAMSRLGAAAIPFLRRGVEGKAVASNPTTRAGIAHVLGAIDHANARDLLSELMGDTHPTVRSRAVTSRGHLGGPATVAALKPALGDADLSVRLAALRALGHLGGSEALAALDGFAPGDDAALARALRFAAFEASRGKRHRDHVLKVLVDGDIPTRGAAHAVLVAVTDEALGYETTADETARRAAAERYRELLAR